MNPQQRRCERGRRRPPPDACPVLQQLCALSEIATSEEMREFLALNTDARIAFVKKPFIVSRIDKVPPPGAPALSFLLPSSGGRVMNPPAFQIVVNAIVDTLKTAFPRPEAQSPTEDDGDVDGLKLGSEKKSK